MLDHPVILIIVIAAALLRWLWQKSQAENQDSERPTVPGEPIPRASETQTEEERIRRFLEALGQPATSTPPRKVTPKRQIVETFKRLSEPMLPPLVTVPPPLPSLPTSTVTPPPIPPSQMEETVFTPAMVQEVGFEVRDLGAQTSSDLIPGAYRTAAEQQSLSMKLRSPPGLRDAIVLREIFGPPRSLQALDPISGF
jgi:hypothetical protein